MIHLTPATGWSGIAVALVVFGFAPGSVLRVLVRAYPKDHPRRRELFAELYTLRFGERPFFVAQQLETALFEGLPARWHRSHQTVAALRLRERLPSWWRTNRRVSRVDDVLRSREAFAARTFSGRIKDARQVWIYGPSAVNLLTSDTVEHIRRTVLAHPDGTLRVMILDPESSAAIDVAALQLDGPTDSFAQMLETTTARLHAIARWSVAGRIEHRYAPFNPGFSVVAIDPDSRHGTLIIEFHGVHNTSTASRMHFELTRSDSDRWYLYWRDQFEHLWHNARSAPEPGNPAQNV